MLLVNVLVSFSHFKHKHNDIFWFFNQEHKLFAVCILETWFFLVTSDSSTSRFCSDDFDRNWTDYRIGFGSVPFEYWKGNKLRVYVLHLKNNFMYHFFLGRLSWIFLYNLLNCKQVNVWILCNYNLTEKYFINIEIVSFWRDIFVHVRVFKKVTVFIKLKSLQIN